MELSTEPVLRMTPQMQLVVRRTLAARGGEWYGLEIVRATGLTQGSVYPMLARMERWGWVTVRYESRQEIGDGRRPGRRYLRFTAEGMAAARAALDRATSNPVLDVAS